MSFVGLTQLFSVTGFITITQTRKDTLVDISTLTTKKGVYNMLLGKETMFPEVC